MQECEVLSALISDIYDATLEPASWPEVLGKMTHFVGGQAAGLLLRDAASKSAQAVHTYGVAPDYVRLYFDHYAKLDPTAPALFFFEPGQVVGAADVLPYDEFVETRFYKEWAGPQGWVNSAQIILEKSATSFALVSFLRNPAAGQVNEETRRLANLIVPHLRRAVLISKVIDLQSAEAAMLSDTVDSLSAGMFFVNPRGQIVHANLRGHALLAEGSPLRAVGGKLAADNAVAEQALHEVFLAAGNGDAAVGVKGIAVALASKSGESYVAHVMPLTSGARRRTGRHYTAAAALFVQRAELQLPSAPETVASFYKLTPSELRVLLAIVQLSGARETADALGINETTVRTHLQRLFAKTGTSRQADLVKLLAGFSNPFVG